MGSGEDWLSLWHVFLEDLDPAFEVRLAYLRRHPPAPINWADAVYDVLHPSEPDEDEEPADPERRAELRRMGLIASDASFRIWLSQQQDIRWPWEYGESPENAARYRTREFSFWSRQVAGLRNNPAWVPPPVPRHWLACAGPLATGEVGDPDLGRGLTTLARMLAAGSVAPPWRLGCTLDDFADSFDDDMGFVDAFRLWGMSSLDDREQLRAYLDATDPPKSWEAWAGEHFFVE
jgi:hypothetical protein